MSFAFTAGSLGDIIAVVTLIKDLIELLDDSRGSVKDYREVVARLSIQLVAVEQVDKIFGGQAQTTKAAEIQAEVRQILAQIKKCAEDFKAKLEKFRPSFVVGGSKNKPKDILKKVSWRLKKEEIETFEKSLVFHTGLLKVYITMKTLYTTESNRDHISRQITQSSNESRTAFQAQSKILRVLGTFIVVLGRALFLQLHQVAQACQDIKMTMAQMFQLMVAILPLLQTALGKLEQLTPPPGSLYFTLVDHLRVRRRIYLDNILSWDMFHRFIVNTYQFEMRGRRLASELSLKDRRLTQGVRRVYRGTPWERAFKPLQTVHLSFQHEIGNPLEYRGACPRCYFFQPARNSQADKKCSNCGLHFSLVLDLIEVNDLADETYHRPVTQEHPERGLADNAQSLHNSNMGSTSSEYPEILQNETTTDPGGGFFVRAGFLRSPVEEWINDDDDVAIRLVEASGKLG